MPVRAGVAGPQEAEHPAQVVDRVPARELHGSERDAAWNDVILATLPGVAKYARKAGRTIPVAILTPLGQAENVRPVSRS
jgi:hypothetical protein